MYLVGAVAAPKLLDGPVGAPGQLQGEVHAPPLVACAPAVFAGCSTGAGWGPLALRDGRLLQLAQADAHSHTCMHAHKYACLHARADLSAWSEMPAEAASLMMAISFSPDMNSSFSCTLISSRLAPARQRTGER